MTVALGTILRSALNKQQYVAVDEELDSLRKYMTIQEYRYRKRVAFSVECGSLGAVSNPPYDTAAAGREFYLPRGGKDADAV